MIPHKEEWHYLAVKMLPALLRGITSKHQGDFCCLDSLHFFRTKCNFESHKKLSENKDVYNIVIPSEETKILEFNQYQISDKAPSTIYADLEYLMEKIDGCKTNPKNSFTTKVGENIPLGFSLSTILAFKSIENKYDVYRVKNCMKRFF